MIQELPMKPTTTYMISRVDIRSCTLNQVPHFSKIPHFHSNDELGLVKCFHQPSFVTSRVLLGKSLQRCLASLQTIISFTQGCTTSQNSGSCLVRGGHHCSILQQRCNNLHRLVKLRDSITNNMQCILSSLQCHTSMTNKRYSC